MIGVALLLALTFSSGQASPCGSSFVTPVSEELPELVQSRWGPLFAEWFISTSTEDDFGLVRSGAGRPLVLPLSVPRPLKGSIKLQWMPTREWRCQVVRRMRDEAGRLTLAMEAPQLQVTVEVMGRGRRLYRREIAPSHLHLAPEGIVIRLQTPEDFPSTFGMIHLHTSGSVAPLEDFQVRDSLLWLGVTWSALLSDPEWIGSALSTLEREPIEDPPSGEPRVKAASALMKHLSPSSPSALRTIAARWAGFPQDQGTSGEAQFRVGDALIEEIWLGGSRIWKRGDGRDRTVTLRVPKRRAAFLWVVWNDQISKVDTFSPPPRDFWAAILPGHEYRIDRDGFHLVPSAQRPFLGCTRVESWNGGMKDHPSRVEPILLESGSEWIRSFVPSFSIPHSGRLTWQILSEGRIAAAFEPGASLCPLPWPPLLPTPIYPRAATSDGGVSR